MLSKEKIIEEFTMAFAQYCSIDRSKADHFGTLVQGFIGMKKGEEAHIYPFAFKNKLDIDPFLNYISTIECESMGVSFVQYYIHYNYML